MVCGILLWQEKAIHNSGLLQYQVNLHETIQKYILFSHEAVTETLVLRHGNSLSNLMLLTKLYSLIVLLLFHLVFTLE